ncbi:MAG: hypothetical protein ACRD2E_06050 [Terriglobales bacterium]
MLAAYWVVKKDVPAKTLKPFGLEFMEEAVTGDAAGGTVRAMCCSTIDSDMSAAGM